MHCATSRLRILICSDANMNLHLNLFDKREVVDFGAILQLSCRPPDVPPETLFHLLICLLSRNEMSISSPHSAPLQFIPPEQWILTAKLDLLDIILIQI